MNNVFAKVVVVALFACILGCNNEPAKNESPLTTVQQSNRIVAVSYALQYLTQRIAGADIQVEFPMPADANPKTWRPNVESIQRMQSADLVVANAEGVRFATWIDRVSLNDSKICNSATGLELDDFILVEDHAIVHRHGNEGEHSHPFLVPYIWLDPGLAKKQAKKILESLRVTYPDQSAEFEQRFEELEQELDQLAAELKSIDGKQTAIITLNPSFKFMTRAANFFDRHLLIFEPTDVEKNAARLKSIREEVKPIGKMIVPRGFDLSPIRGMLEAQNLSPIEFDLLDRSGEGDYFSRMRENIEKLKSFLRSDD